MTEENDAAIRLTRVSASDLIRTRPKKVLTQIYSDLLAIGVSIKPASSLRDDLSKSLTQIGADDIRQAGRAFLGQMPPGHIAGPMVKGAQIKAMVKRASHGITAEECNEFLRGLPRLDPDNMEF